MTCSQCRADNPPEDRFCGQCGAALATVAEAQPDLNVPGEEGAYYCAKHRKEVTRVRCGRCEKPICTRCTVFGPAGVRCRDCARNRVPVRPMGVLHEVGRTVGDPGVGRVVWYAAVWSFFVSIFSGIFGGRDS